MPTAGSCNSTNYKEYEAYYGYAGPGAAGFNGKCRDLNGNIITACGNDADGKTPIIYNDADYACYAQNSLNELRNKMDPQIADIFNPANSVRNISESNLDTTMLSGVLWVMLGTTILYYTFTKI